MVLNLFKAANRIDQVPTRELESVPIPLGAAHRGLKPRPVSAKIHRRHPLVAISSRNRQIKRKPNFRTVSDWISNTTLDPTPQIEKLTV